MKNRIVTSLTIVFVIMLLVFVVFANLNKPRVFVLHSYSTEFSWVKDINTGLNRILRNRPYAIRWHYMDTKRHPSLEYKKKAGETAVKMIKQWKPNIIIAVDDNAQEFAAAHFKNYRNINIVFTGVNATVKSYGYDKAKNVTGVLERIPFNEFREVFVQLLPKNKRRIA